MSAPAPNPADFGMHGLAPHLVCKGAAAAIDFYVTAFGATELMRLPGADGRLMHGSIMVNNCMVMNLAKSTKRIAMPPRRRLAERLSFCICKSMIAMPGLRAPSLLAPKRLCRWTTCSGVIVTA
jgi:hypothetical protein